MVYFLIKKDNNYIISIDKKSILIIDQVIKNKVKYNLIKYYKNNLLIYEWKDTYVKENYFIRAAKLR